MPTNDTTAAGDGGARLIGWIEGLCRYPVTSMRGASLDAAALTWHGVDGDRRLALRRLGERGGFPWLTAGTCPDPGETLPVFAEALETASRTCRSGQVRG